MRGGGVENKEFFVRFDGQIDDSKISIQRTYEITQSSIKESLFLEIDTEKFYDDEAQHRLNNILPENFVEFFFFDGEEIEKIGDNLRTKLREKIVDILQIKPLEIIIKQAQLLRDDLLKSQTENSKQKNEIEVKKSQQDTKEKEINAKNEAISNTQRLLDDKRERVKALQRKRDKLIADSSAELNELTREKDDIEQNLHQQKQNLSESMKSIVFASNASLMQRLKDELEKVEHSTQKSDIQALRRLLPDMTLLGNQKIDTLHYEQSTKAELQEFFSTLLQEMPHNLEFKLAKEYSKIPLQLIGEIRESIVRTESSTALRDIEAIKKLKKEIVAVKESISELTTDEYVRKEKEEIDEELAKCEEEIKNYQAELENFKRELTELKIGLENLTKELNSLEQRIDIERIRNKLHLLDVLKESIEAYREKLVSALRIELHDMILDKYKRTITDDNIAELEIDENFEIKLKDKYGEPITVESQSAGQKQVLAICIFGALSELSKSQIPFILDTPLSRIDSKNRANIIKHYYSKAGNQVIILPLDTEMGAKEYEFVKPNLAGIYTIQNDDDRSHARIKEVQDIREIL